MVWVYETSGEFNESLAIRSLIVKGLQKVEEENEVKKK